ncbi:MAG: hypothetical protein Q8K30_01650 [Candidatus Gracilibacteria bacterium]|nr:hypothetical protein [Candidatus Gracilibacteria bacterium]
MKEILELYKLKQSVFNFDDLKSIFGIINNQVLKNKLQFLKSKNIIESVAKGIYILKDKEINKFELVNKIYSPSYISFFSALYHYSIIFQYDTDVYLAYMKSDSRKILDFEIKLKTLKNEILLNPSGIINNGLYSIASKERAFLDTLYLYSDIHLDNISGLDYDKVISLLDVYNNKLLEKKAKSYFLK